MDMKDLNEMSKDVDLARAEWEKKCVLLYHAYSTCNPLLLNEYYKEARVAEFAYESAMKDLLACYNNEAETVSYKEDENV